jgi:hypothetical protein
MDRERKEEKKKAADQPALIAVGEFFPWRLCRLGNGAIIYHYNGLLF